MRTNRTQTRPEERLLREALVPAANDELVGVEPHIVGELEGAHGVAGAQLHGNVHVLGLAGLIVWLVPGLTSGLASPLSTIRTASNRKGTSSLGGGRGGLILEALLALGGEIKGEDYWLLEAPVDDEARGVFTGHHCLPEGSPPGQGCLGGP